MKILTLFLLLTVMLTSAKTQTFKEEQQRYPRVRKAYADKESSVKQLLSKHSIEMHAVQIYLRAFKEEKKLELWAKNTGDSKFIFIKEYVVCQTSGSIGPKRQQGDLQIPEGYYHINRFNPASNFYLSLGINYPNKSDAILGVKGNLGGDIFIHGACVTIGCLPITDNEIKELYVFCVEARNSGQKNIPVTIFPCELTPEKLIQLKGKYNGNTAFINLWSDLERGYAIFNETKQLPNIGFLNNGRHSVTE